MSGELSQGARHRLGERMLRTAALALVALIALAALVVDGAAPARVVASAHAQDVPPADADRASPDQPAPLPGTREADIHGSGTVSFGGAGPARPASANKSEDSRLLGPYAPRAEMFMRGDELGGVAGFGYVPRSSVFAAEGAFVRTDRVWDVGLRGHIEIPLKLKRTLYLDAAGHLGEREEREFRHPTELSEDVGAAIRTTAVSYATWQASVGVRKLLWRADALLGLEGTHITNTEAALGSDATCDEVVRDAAGCPIVPAIGEPGTDLALRLRVQSGRMFNVDGVRLGKWSLLSLAKSVSSDYDSWWTAQYEQINGDKMFLWLYTTTRLGFFGGGGLPFFRELTTGYDIVSGRDVLPGHPVGARRATWGAYLQGEAVVAPSWLGFFGFRPGVGVQAGGAILWLQAADQDGPGRRFTPDESGIWEKLAGNVGVFGRIGRGPLLLEAGWQQTAQSGNRLFFTARWRDL